MYKTTAFLLIFTLCSLISLSAQTPVAPLPQNDKLKLRLKAKLPDYKGPSRFVGRKALITFSPDGRLVAMSGTKRTITVWDIETGALKAKLKGGNDGISGFAFSPDGKTAATRNYLDKSVRLWDTATWEVKTTLPGRKKNLETRFKAGLTYEQEFGPVPFSPDGRTVLAEREDDLVQMADVANGQERFTLNHDTRDSGTKDFLKAMFFRGGGHFLALQTGFSGDGRWVFTINGDKSAKIWYAATGQLKTSISNNERIYRASFDPGSSRLLTVEQQGGMKLWDVETGARTGQIAQKGVLENWMKSFEFSPEGQTIATFFFGDTRIWDVRSGELKFKLLKSETIDAVFSPDGKWLATASSEQQSAAKIWDVATGVVRITLPSTNKSVSVAFSPDGTILATTNDAGVTLWDTQTGDLLTNLTDARYPVAFSADGRTMVTGARKDTALLWEIPRRN